ncbi:MAG: hypothetical protein ABJB11_24735 [Ferruginibacter sp.]
MLFYFLPLAVYSMLLFRNNPVSKTKIFHPKQGLKILDEKLMQLQCIRGQKPSIMTNGDFDETKAAKFLKMVATLY